LHRARPLALLIAMLVALSLAACGGDDGGGESDADPAQVLEATFNNDADIQSGTFEVAIKLDAEGDQGGEVETSLGGPFQSTEGEIPAFEVDGSLKAETPLQDFDISGALISTGQAAYVSYEDTNYQVPQEAFDTFAQRFLQLQQQGKDQQGEAGNFLKSLGVDPSNWLTGLENEGTEDVEGDETVHVSGDADVPKLVEDLRALAENAGSAAGQISPEQIDQLGQLEDVVKEASIDVYSGTEDDILRKLEASLVVEAPEGTPGATGPVEVDFSITLGEINEPQEIATPEGAEPLESLLGQFGLDASALEGALGGSALPQAGGSPEAPEAGAADAYLQCLQTAQGAAETQACAELL
jgi:hypothetical protein